MLHKLLTYFSFVSNGLKDTQHCTGLTARKSSTRHFVVKNSQQFSLLLGTGLIWSNTTRINFGKMVRLNKKWACEVTVKLWYSGRLVRNIIPCNKETNNVEKSLITEKNARLTGKEARMPDLVESWTEGGNIFETTLSSETEFHDCHDWWFVY